MRSSFLLLVTFFSILAIASCGLKSKGTSTADANDPVKQDSVKKIEIDTFLSHINRKIREQKLPVSRIPNPTYNTTDSIMYWFTSDHDARISDAMHPDTNVIWPNYWVYKGDLILIRYREFKVEAGVSHASETMIYLDKGNIVYCAERGKDLGTDEVPGVVRRMEYVPSTRTNKALHDLYEPLWKATLEQFKKQGLLPEWLKS